MDRLLLDTCAILRLASGVGELSRAALSAIAKASVIFVSPISLWEIALKTRNGNIILPVSAEDYFNDVVQEYDLSIAPLSLAVMSKSVDLPPIHRDPADRFLIATALLNDLTIVTTDRRFREYNVKVVG